MTGDPLEVRITREAEADLQSIHRHYAEEAGSPQAADRIVSAVLDAAESLALFPDRGTVPKELEAAAVLDFRQVIEGHYRIVYRVVGATVYVVVIADGRRDMATLLDERILAL